MEGGVRGNAEISGLNQYSAAGSASFLYDANLRSDGANAYVYDAENRLVTATGSTLTGLNRTDTTYDIERYPTREVNAAPGLAR